MTDNADSSNGVGGDAAAQHDSTVDLTGIGEHRPDNRRGLLVFTNLPDAVQRAEDSTAYADHENRHWRASVTRTRPATPTERALLAHLGYTLPDDLTTRVEWLSNGVRRRTWPQLETMEDTQ